MHKLPLDTSRVLPTASHLLLLLLAACFALLLFGRPLLLKLLFLRVSLFLQLSLLILLDGVKLSGGRKKNKVSVLAFH